VDELSCPSCSTQLPAASKFCFNCGHELAAGSTYGQAGRPAQAVTATIADQLRASGPGERRRITLLFCDVQDSTATAERLDPEDWAEIMRGALSRFIAPVERYGGTVARILGDAILAYFGAPVAHEDDPRRAVLAGLAITESCRDLAEDVRRRFGLPFGVRVGINTGLVVVGDVGSTLYGEYAALGDAANVAARMEQTADVGTVRIAEPSYRLVSAYFDVDPIGAIAVKGRQEPVPSYRVLQAKATPGSGRGIAGLHSPVVGRDEESARLRGLLTDLTAWQGQVAALIGEAGLGKSRLASELAAEFAATVPNGTWIEGACFSYEDSTPYAPFARALRGFFGLDPQADAGADDHERVAQRATELLGDDGRRTAAHLATIVGTELPEADQEFIRFLEPPMLRQRTFAAVAQLFEALATRAPTVVTIDDLHWADPTSTDLVQSLLPLTERVPLLLLLRFRPAPAIPDLGPRHTAIELGPLPQEAARDLVANLLRIEGLTREARDLILRKAEGNPFFVEEVIRSLLDAGIITSEGERFVVAGDIGDFHVPDTLVGVLSARIDALEPTARRVLQTAAVVGREFGDEMLRELADRSDGLDDALAELERREMVVPTASAPERTYAFKHALTRDATYDTLLLSVRRDLHRQVGKLVEERHPDRVHDLAYHFLEADEPFRALPYLVDAGDRSFRAFALLDAARLYRQALDIWSDGQDAELARRAYEGLGNARLFAGNIAGALEALTAMEAFAVAQNDPRARTSALNKQGMVHLLGTGDLVEAQRVMLEARALALANDDVAGLAEFHVGFCALNVETGQLDVATEHLGEAAEVCFTLDPFHRNFGLTHYATALLYSLRLDEARAAFDRAWRQALADDDKLHQAHLWIVEAELDLIGGNPERGLEHVLHAVRISEEIGAPLEDALCSWAAGSLAVQLGRYQTAAEYLKRSATVGRQLGFFAVVAAGLSGLAVVHQAVHGPGTERVRELVAEAQPLLSMPMSGFTVGALSIDLGYTLLHEGDLDGADAALRMLDERPSATMLLAKPDAMLCAGYIALARGETETGLARLREAAMYVEEHGLHHLEPRTMLGEAVIASHAGDAATMAERLTAADEAATRMRLRPDVLLIRTRAARLLDAAGLPDQAAGFRDRVADAVAEIAELIEDSEKRVAFLRTNALVAG
jgi:class 3 adenylate cyclase/tetratricopeptide (TPR) repeat protein